eukprot:m.14469 g.14469  ORF g.14469 m.14469 type:complete len:235 (-) comp3153_c0_seq1:87-791(-)
MAEVTLQLYTVGSTKALQTVNKITMMLPGSGKMGAFHAAVEVYDKEWAYGKVDGPGTGVFWNTPTHCDMHQYDSAIPLGRTALTEPQVLAVIRALEPQWAGNEYDILRRNCCSFAAALCDELGVGPLPKHVSTMANVGVAVVDTVSVATSYLTAGVGAISSCANGVDERHQVSQKVNAATTTVLEVGSRALGALFPGSTGTASSASPVPPAPHISRPPYPTSATPPAYPTPSAT